jgi:hypothetical protein
MKRVVAPTYGGSIKTTTLEGIGGSRMLLLSGILALDFGRGHRPDWALAGKVVVTAAMDDDGGEGIG